MTLELVRSFGRIQPLNELSRRNQGNEIKKMQALSTRGGRRLAPFVSRQSGLISRNLSSLGPGVPEDMPYIHHGHRPRHRGYQKFKSPRKKASKLFEELNNEAVEKSKEANPAMWQEKIRVGDSVELQMVTQGGLHEDGDKQAQEVEKVRGVVLGLINRGLGSSMILRDVVYGQPIERKIPMHSPMIKEVKVLERNFIFKGKKKVKRAKLYYFRDLNPLRKFTSCFLPNSTTIWSKSLHHLQSFSNQGIQILIKTSDHTFYNFCFQS